MKELVSDPHGAQQLIQHTAERNQTDELTEDQPSQPK